MLEIWKWQRPVKKNLFVINLIWKHLLSTKWKFQSFGRRERCFHCNQNGKWQIVVIWEHSGAIFVYISSITCAPCKTSSDWIRVLVQIKFITNKFFFTGRCHFQISNIRITKRFWLAGDDDYLRVATSIIHQVALRANFKMYSRSAKGGEKRDPNRNPWLAKMPLPGLTPVYLVRSVLLIFLVFYDVFVFLVLCILCTVLSVSLRCPILISSFSYVYLTPLSDTLINIEVFCVMCCYRLYIVTIRVPLLSTLGGSRLHFEICAQCHLVVYRSCAP
jgi:hypothetical protein